MRKFHAKVDKRTTDDDTRFQVQSPLDCSLDRLRLLLLLLSLELLLELPEDEPDELEALLRLLDLEADLERDRLGAIVFSH